MKNILLIACLFVFFKVQVSAQGCVAIVVVAVRRNNGRTGI